MAEPLHMSNLAQISRFTTALEKPMPTQLPPGGQSVARLGVWPPAYGTVEVSALSSQAMMVMGRGSVHLHAVWFAAVTGVFSGSVPVTQRKSTGAAAAIRSAASQAIRYVM